MRRLRLAGLVLGAWFVVILAAQLLLLERVRHQAQVLARIEPATSPAIAASQLALAHQSLHTALLEHRLGAPDMALRQAYETFAGRLEAMRSAAREARLAGLPGLAPTLDSATALAARIDALLDGLPPDQMPGTLSDPLLRGLAALREPLALLTASVQSAQVLARADRLARLGTISDLARLALVLLLAAAASVAIGAWLALRQLRRSLLLQSRLAARAQELRAEARAAVAGRLEVLGFVAGETQARIGKVAAGLGRVLEHPELDARQRELLLATRMQTDDLLVLATDLADLARLEAGEMRLRPAPFRLADAMEQAADLLRQRFRAEAVAFVVRAPESLPSYWVGDAARVRQLLHHLGSTAAEYRAGGTVELSAELPEAGEDGLLLQAANAEEGAVLPRQATAREPAAHGLSLTLVRTLTAAMGGRFFRTDEPLLASPGPVSQGAPPGGPPGRGVAFQAILPLSACAAPEAAVPAPLPDAMPLQRPLELLVVDDVVLNRRLLAAVLERFGHHCELATDGLEALRAVQQRRFDAVLMDIQMPNLDGLAATRMLRALPPPAGLVPVIAVTAAGEASDRAAYAAAGMDGFVAKPVATGELMAAIAAATRGRVAAGGGEPGSGRRDFAVGPLMDTQTLAILRSTLAPDELARLVATTESEANQALRAAEAAAASGDAQALGEAAAGVGHACEAVGALRVVAIARAMAEAADGPVARVAAHLPALRRAVGETLTTLARRPSATPAAASPPIPILTPAQAKPEVQAAEDRP